MKAGCTNCSTLWRLRENAVETVRICSGCRRVAAPPVRKPVHLELLQELATTLRARTMLWALPVIIVMLAFAGMILLAHVSAIPPLT